MMHTDIRQRMSPRASTGKARLQTIFESGFPFSKKLVGHRSCVNAITFSRGDGRWLASAGDDLTVKLWDFHQESIVTASHSLVGHLANIFCLEFSARNQYLFSGGLDEKVIRHDIAVNTALSTISSNHTRDYMYHDSPIRGISCSSESDEVLLTASESGHIILFDLRASNTRPSSEVTSCSAEPTDVRYHPQSDKLFLTSDSHGHVLLRDARMAFGSDGQTSDGGTVMKYVTGISRNSVSFIVKPEASNVAFDRDGKKFAVINLHHFPTIYSISDPYPLATCSGRKENGVTVPTESRTYSNSCTTKHGSFGGPGLNDDIYFGTGSDDFRAYVWKIPDLVELEQGRRIVKLGEWMTEESPRTIGYTTRMEEDRYVPVDLDDPLLRLQGNKSIVNNCIFHPHLPQIVTSGVEDHIAVHSPTRTAPNMEFSPTDPNVRALPDHTPDLQVRYVRALLDGHALEEGHEATEGQRTIDFFDGVIREYEDINVFTARRRR